MSEHDRVPIVTEVHRRLSNVDMDYNAYALDFTMHMVVEWTRSMDPVSGSPYWMVTAVGFDTRRQIEWYVGFLIRQNDYRIIDTVQHSLAEV